MWGFRLPEHKVVNIMLRHTCMPTRVNRRYNTKGSMLFLERGNVYNLKKKKDYKVKVLSFEAT